MCGVVPGFAPSYARHVPPSSSMKAAKRLATVIKARRLMLGFSQEEAAHRSQMNTRHYQKLEAAELNVTLRTLVRVAAALRIKLSDLFR